MPEDYLLLAAELALPLPNPGNKSSKPFVLELLLALLLMLLSPAFSFLPKFPNKSSKLLPGFPLLPVGGDEIVENTSSSNLTAAAADLFFKPGNPSKISSSYTGLSYTGNEDAACREIRLPTENIAEQRIVNGSTIGGCGPHRIGFSTGPEPEISGQHVQIIHRAEPNQRLNLQNQIQSEETAASRVNPKNRSEKLGARIWGDAGWC
ncbi:glyoxalase II 3 [Striga asiatica]|uniref:Glyoxalase II 3 n=1 Tax=Striga asiatica TaxID=4170 RepID=A0A5A7RBE3_STRAF|nr:glyoxalase II 3 [Striga asiatica]